MFPFLSVLCTVIGVLVLFIVLVLSTRIVIEEERYEDTQAHDRKPKPGSEDVLEEGIDDLSFEELQAELTRLERLLVDRKTQRDRLLEKLDAVEDLLEFKKTELLVPAMKPPVREFNKPQPVAMVPDENVRSDLSPILVEVSSSGYIVHPSREEYPPIQRDKNDNLKVPPKLMAFFKKVNARHTKEYLVFLIHPNGVANFDALREYQMDKYAKIRVGWEPFSSNWILAAEANN